MVLSSCNNFLLVDLTSWENKIAEEMHLEFEYEEDDSDVEIGKTINVSITYNF